MSGSNACQVRVHEGVGRLRRPEWNALVDRSVQPTVFLRSGFLLAAAAAYEDAALVRIFEARLEGRLVGALALVQDGRRWRALGAGAGDYLDVVLDAGLSAAERARVVAALFRAPLAARGSVLVLPGVVLALGTPALLRAAGLDVTELRVVPAPTMDAEVFGAALSKKSMKRHTRKMARAGELTFVCLSDAESIAAQLPGFFAQHIARWADTETPSMFALESHQKFYRELVARLAPTGVLRFHEVRLDGALVACHLGFESGGRFTWYKPAFSPEFASLSPGEVLLRRLIEDASAASVDEFDFTVGGESFKFRFASRVRTVVDLQVTASRPFGWGTRAYLRVRDTTKSVLEASGYWARLRRVVGR